MQTSESPPLAPVQAQLRKVLAHVPSVTLTLLFVGSVAADRAHSDLGIAVLAQSPLSVAQHIAITQRLQKKNGHPIDLLDLVTAPEPLLGQIVQNGQRILGSDNSYARLIQHHLSEQADSMPYRNRVLAERRMAWIGK